MANELKTNLTSVQIHELTDIMYQIVTRCELHLPPPLDDFDHRVAANVYYKSQDGSMCISIMVVADKYEDDFIHRFMKACQSVLTLRLLPHEHTSVVIRPAA